MTTSCACGPQWRVEAADLATGIPLRVLPVVAMDLGIAMNKAAPGTLTLNVEDVTIRDVWPHRTSIFVTREDVPVWAGYIEKIAIQDRTLQVGMFTLDDYLNHRRLRERRAYVNTPQTVIGADLVEYARVSNGIPLYGLAGPSTVLRDRTFEAWNRSPVGTLVEQLTGVIDGPDWFPRWEKINNAWRMTMVFVDELGGDRGVTIIGDVHGEGHQVDIDARDHANLIDATGGGQEADMLIATAADTTGAYPRFDDAPSFVDVNDQTVLQEYADGELQSRREPWATPTVQVVKHTQQIDLGDTVRVDSGIGAGTYRGTARVAGWVWRAAAGDADRRDIQVVPLSNATDALYNQTPRQCEDC